jgi:hypothetical protein
LENRTRNVDRSITRNREDTINSSAGAPIITRNGVLTVLVRETFREYGKVKKRTVANITHLPTEVQDLVGRALAGEKMAAAPELEILQTQQHGHVEAVMLAMRKLKLAPLISPTARPERDLVMALIAARILVPSSKLAVTRWWENTTRPEVLGLAPRYLRTNSMEPRIGQQVSIEKRLAKKHLETCGLVLYDLTSSYVEGTKCELATRGYSRDKKVGLSHIRKRPSRQYRGSFDRSASGG